MAGKIFVNYRRDDSPAHAISVAQYLEATFGKRNVFLDIDRMRAGQSFPTVLKERLSASKVMLAIIGPAWLDLKGEDGRRRLDDPADWVRLEIATALATGTVVIPVLVGGARLPRKAELPPDLQALTDQHAVTVTTNGFRNEMSGLARDIHAIPGPLPWVKIGGGVAAVLVLVLGGWAAAYQLGVPVWVPSGRVEPLARPDAPRAVVDVGSPASTRPTADAGKATADKAQAEREAKLIADAEARIMADIAAKQKAEAERQRIAAAAKAEADVVKKKAEEESATRPGRVFRDCTDDCPEMVVVPAGSFTMGSNESDDEKPPRTVTIRQAFAVGKFEVTFAEWEACVAHGGCTSNRSPADRGWGKGRRPVIDVSWDDAKQYVAWLSRKTGQTYRLLTEAEWEYAARAGSTGRWSFGDDERRLGEFGWYTTNSGNKTQPVGGKSANAFGLHDMHGNVWEWVEDCYADTYNGAPTDGSAARETQGCSRVLRGGGWINNPQGLRSAFRFRYSPGLRYNSLGLRLARTIKP